MKIGILGSGDVGQALGAGFVARGHDVKMGTRDSGQEKVRAWVKKTGARASAGTFEEAARFGELAVLATLGAANEAVIRAAGPKQLARKVVIDATNPLTFESGKLPTLFVGHTDSGGEQVQRLLPEALVVKAFNTVGHALMVDPKLPGGPPDMFICGNDAGAKKTVSELCRNFGWGVIDTGGIEGSRYLEAMCIVWVYHGIISSSWSHAFKMLRM